MSEINLSIYHDVGLSTESIRAVENLINSKGLHWIQVNEEGIFELILDNQMMSDFRSCPAYFINAHVEGIYSRGRSWDLDFGLWFHKMMEIYYENFRSGNFDLQDWAIKTGIELWNKMDMNAHVQAKGYNIVGGPVGATGLILAYALRFSPENERLRIIGTEISFGKAREVPLGILFNGKQIYLKMFLSGRIDVLVDDGTSICPMDHKTLSTMRYDPAQRYEMDEGPTGYIFAINNILPAFIQANGLDASLLRRSCNKIIMNFISKTPTKEENERFKRIPLMKTSEQLGSYQYRMLLTGDKIFRTLVNYACGLGVERDVSKCTNWYMHDCVYLPIHRQNSSANELMMINQFYERRPIWDTENIKGE